MTTPASAKTPRYPAPELKDVPEDIRAKILEVQEKAGFVPQVFLAFARRPAEWRAFFAYHDALMVPESVGRTSNLTKGDREMIVTTTSAANNCLYCVVAHGAILRIYEKKPLVADQVGRRGHLGHCGYYRLLWPVKPHGQLQQHDAQPRVLFDGPGAQTKIIEKPKVWPWP